jgi:hypothetical protein
VRLLVWVVKDTIHAVDATVDAAPVVMSLKKLPVKSMSLPIKFAQSKIVKILKMLALRLSRPNLAIKESSLIFYKLM